MDEYKILKLNQPYECMCPKSEQLATYLESTGWRCWHEGPGWSAKQVGVRDGWLEFEKTINGFPMKIGVPNNADSEFFTRRMALSIETLARVEGRHVMQVCMTILTVKNEQMQSV